jgi:hypothetical protein
VCNAYVFVRGAAVYYRLARDVKETLEMYGEGGGKALFQFDRVFGPAARQEDIFKEVLPVLQVRRAPCTHCPVSASGL